MRGLWSKVMAFIRRVRSDEEDDEESRFIPSPLDRSVRIGHGGRDDEIERELVQIEKQARDLDDTYREN